MFEFPNNCTIWHQNKYDNEPGGHCAWICNQMNVYGYLTSSSELEPPNHPFTNN